MPMLKNQPIIVCNIHKPLPGVVLQRTNAYEYRVDFGLLFQQGEVLERLQHPLTPTRVDQRSQGIMFSNWRVGQTLSALVGDRMPNGGLLLSVGSQKFVTSRDIPVQPGSEFNLRFSRLSQNCYLDSLAIRDLLRVHPTPENFVSSTLLMPQEPEVLLVFSIT